MKLLSSDVSVNGKNTSISIIFEKGGETFNSVKIFHGENKVVESMDLLCSKEELDTILTPSAVEEPTTKIENVSVKKASGSVPAQKVRPQRWTTEEEIEVFNSLYQGKTVNEIVSDSRNNRKYNGIHLRLVKIYEDFMSNDASRFGAVEQGLLNLGVDRNDLISFISNFKLEPLKQYKK